MLKKVELLSPAGDLNRGIYALNYGADALYLGAKAFSLRARASNFEIDEIAKIISYAHSSNKKVYLVTNIICHNVHMTNFISFIKELIKLQPDGFICADPYVINEIRKINKDIEIHISTQQSVTNSKAALFFKDNGANRIVLAREVSYQQVVDMIKHLHNAIDIEYFIHGALCISYSGKCMISNNFSLRDSNVGGCSQSCRWVYSIYDENKVYSNKFSMSAKDMNQITNIPKLIESGIHSFKIEGRMKSEYYLATVVNTYRKLIDEYYENHNIHDFNKYLNEITHAENRKAACGWFYGSPNKDGMLYHDIPNKVNQLFAFVIYKKINSNTYEVISRNNFNKNQIFEIIGPNHDTYSIGIKQIIDENNNQLGVVPTPMTKCKLVFDNDIDLSINDIGRIK